MSETRIKISSVVENQLPEFVREEFPLVSEFLKQYYTSLESQGLPYNLIQNLDQYIKLDNLSNLVVSTALTSDINFFDTTITVSSTAGFPDRYGLILIGDEIITYTSKSTTQFLGCVRGFSGVTSLTSSTSSDELVFKDTSSADHSSGAKVNNLSILFLQEFFKKLKIQVAPGFDDRELSSSLNQRLFIKQAKDFYSSKGSEESFEILFRALYGQDVQVIRPQEFLIQPSDAEYKITQDIVAEVISGDPFKLLNRTIRQDQNSFQSKAQGTVTQVEKILRGNKEYYVLSLDYGFQRDLTLDGTVFGEFSIHPKTLLITEITDTNPSVATFTPSSTSLDVDSTVGFPQSGSLLVNLTNGTELTITYQDKTTTQFLNCTGITQELPSGTEIKTDAFAYGEGDNGTVKFRVTGVLSDITLNHNNSEFNIGDPIKIKTLGSDISDFKFNNWFFNIATSYEAKTVELLDSSTSTYKITFYDDHSFVVGNRISILSSSGTKILGTVTNYGNPKTITVTTQSSLSTSLTYVVTKLLSRVNSVNYPSLSEYSTNVQNVYIDSDNSLIVASPSIPSYLNQSIDVNDKSVTFSGSFSGTDLNIGNHPFYTGDAVYYRFSGDTNNVGITSGFYFVKKVNNTTIKLSKSRANIQADKFLSVSGTVVDNKLEFASFISDTSLTTKQLEPQKLFRKISDPINEKDYTLTESGSVGILVNGVEVLNYKSPDNIFYGPIEGISPVSGGTGYDIINPPVLTITDQVGSGATAHCSVKGELVRIDIVDPGFDYLETPTIKISGGNGSNAETKVNLIVFDHYAHFNASTGSLSINETNDTITFIDDHKFKNFESVIYENQGQTSVGGLSNNSAYFVSVISSKTIKLHASYSDSVLGTNPIQLSNTGSGIQRFRSATKKKKIGSIDVISGGENYQTKKTTAPHTSINSSTNTVTIKNHGYSSGEIVVYDYTQFPVVGLSTTSTYYVTKLDNDNFKLSLVGTSSTQSKDIFYKTNQYVDFIGIGTGTHIFNYEPIEVQISGITGVSTSSNAVLQPIFRGSIDSVHIQNGGNSYGSQEIINYNRQPEISLLSGSGAQLTPVVNNGSIVNVIINNSGSNYNSPPNLIISGSGSGAILTPIVVNGSITEVKVIYGGVNYSQSNTVINAISAGSGAELQTSIKSWNVNLFERYLQTNQITEDDGVLDISLSNFGLQYFHLYAPRKLRSSVFGTRYRDGEIFYDQDLILSGGREIASQAHSPIIGWAYDGNPIYGPYGYSTPSGGAIRSMVSGYEVVLKEGRPSTAIYPIGYFVDDYKFVGSGDLDEHNGRFCITPEYPNGVYAYFTTINSGSVESSGAFRNYKLPVFPYFIGNTYNSKVIDFNKLKTSNQSQTNINDTNWIRNTYPYDLTKRNSGYGFLYNPNQVREQNSYVQNVSKGGISSIGIITGGFNYKVNDSIIFEDSDLGSINPTAKVTTLKGKSVNSVSVATSQVSNVEFYISNFNSNQYVAISSSPHLFNNLDFVTISSDFEVEKTSTSKVITNTLFVSNGIASTTVTGLVTYFSVFTNLNSIDISENDFYQISNEIVKVLSIDKKSSRIKVLRNTNNISGTTNYDSGSRLVELPRKLYVNFTTDNTYEQKRNKQIYFNPVESVGIGTTAGPGITSTIYISNPGVGLTQISIPVRSIYLPNHSLNSGDEVVYTSNGGTTLSVSTDGINSYTLTNSDTLYVTKLSDNLVGISSVKVGLGTTGSYVGLTTTSDLLYFTGVGSGEIHSFSTNYNNILKGKITKNKVTVSTASTHGLQLGDAVNFNIISGISTQVTISYSDSTRRTIINSRGFLSSDVNIASNSIRIVNHGLKTGQKVIHTSSSPAGGLENQKEYYAVVIDDDNIRLSNSFYYSTKAERNIVDITSVSSGSILPVNPQINITENSTLVFDVSSPTLSFTRSGVLYPAFTLDFYTDSNFKYKFEFSSSENIEIVRSGEVGITTTATVSLRTNNKTPKKLYYKLNPTNIDLAPIEKLESIVDFDVVDNNSLTITPSIYTGTFTINGITTNTFNFNLSKIPERSSYTNLQSIINYDTNSKYAFGEINTIKVLTPGTNLRSIPKISRIDSVFGSGALLLPSTNNIGTITNTQITDIGFNYSSDLSVRPKGKLPDIIRISAQSSLKSIGITSVGKGYSLSPNLILFDGLTNQLISDVKLQYDLPNRRVNILENTKSLNNITPTIIPVNNSNGVGINSIRFVEATRDVVVSLGSSFSNLSDFPFVVGDKVLIENISVGVGSTGRGFNSANYNYALFTIKDTTPNIGGIGASVSYNLTEYLTDGRVPGSFDPVNSSGRIIPQKYFPIFDIKLQKNTFNVGETLNSNNSVGIVVGWDEEKEILKVSTKDDFSANSTIIGQSSKSVGTIKEILTSNCTFEVKGSSKVVKGWQKETGFLDNQFQRIHDNDYYQYFSYSLKSNISFDVWNSAVSSLNHTTGFKKFSDLVIESQSSNVGIGTSQNEGDFTASVDIIEVVDTNCVYDFDLVKENNLNIDSSIRSDRLIFNSRILQDYIESISNRVLTIDDFSSSFNSEARPTEYSLIDTFRLDIDVLRSAKYLAFVRDRRYTDQRQVNLITLLQNGSQGYLNQYGYLNTFSELGQYDFIINGIEGSLAFYPIKSEINNYDISLISFDVKDSIVSTGSTDLGDVVFVGSGTTTILSGISSAFNVVGIASTYRSSKVIVQIGATDSSYYEFDEIMLIHDGTNITWQEYGQLTTSGTQSYSSPGIGTYYAYYSGSDIKVDLIPFDTTSVNYDINTVRISIGDNSSTGISTEIYKASSLQSGFVAISSSSTPGITTVITYNSDYQGAYCIVSIEDLTNDQYEVFEVMLVNDSSDVYYSQFGSIQTNGTIGSIGATFNPGSNSAGLTFTPNPDIDVEVRVYQNSIGICTTSVADRTTDLTNSKIRTVCSEYIGSQIGVNTSFNLYHKSLPIFERQFDGSNSSIVDIEQDTIEIPDHFFVSGERLTYTFAGVGSSGPIGIATTTISGIGLTDKLPSTVYAVKFPDRNDRDFKIRLAASVSDALLTPPKILNLTSVGIGTVHKLSSSNQNAKLLLTIDNIIQSPIVSTSTTTVTLTPLNLIDDRVVLSDITNFSEGDLIKIDDEILRIGNIGFGATNGIFVRRSWVGTEVSTHASGSLVTKITGDYNIINNTISFKDAPKGPTPISSTTNPPDSVDFVGVQTYSTFAGRVFLRSGIPGSSNEPYSKNYIFDDISGEFTGFSTIFTLKSNNTDTTDIDNSNAIILINDIFQGPSRPGSVSVVSDYDLSEASGITSISFTGLGVSTIYDVNTATIPRSGIIISVGSTKGFGYQPLVSAGGTAIVSTAGTIQSISIGNSGSGYRVGIQTVVNVAVATSSLESLNIEYIGTANISNGYVTGVAITNPGSGYTSTNPPEVIFDDPISYANIPLIYSSSSSGVGTESFINLVVSQDSSVLSFEIGKQGYGYKNGEILTVNIGGATGIPTTGSSSFNEFQIYVDDIFTDKFSGWSIGDLQVIDPIDNLFDGVRRSFPIKINDNQTTIRSKSGSPIEVKYNLLVFVNNILQIPDQSYIFEGGSIITFLEAPKQEDTSKILFYKGTSSVDTIDVDILEPVKIGDILRVQSDDTSLNQDSRLALDILSTDIVNTNVYSGPGITQNDTLKRPVILCRQTEDQIINGQEIAKNRAIYEPLVQPTTRIIQDIGVASTEIFVESVKTFFDSSLEYTQDGLSELPQKKLIIISEDSIISAAATAIVSAAGTISSILISDGGVGYTTSPTVIIETPVGLGTTQRSEAVASVSIGGSISSITVTSPGTGYTTSNPPLVLIQSPSITREIIDRVSYSGDFGIISGINTSSTGIASTALVFDLFIPSDSYLRDININPIGTGLTVSGIQTGYYFVTYNTNVGNGVTSLREDGSVVGFGSTFIDNVYQAVSVSIAQTSVSGIGLTYVAQVTVSIQDFNYISGLGFSGFYGYYSWGKIEDLIRSNSKSFTHYTNGLLGVSSSPIVQRYNPLRY